jgi:hypothetical protein
MKQFLVLLNISFQNEKKSNLLIIIVLPPMVKDKKGRMGEERSR